MTGSPPPEGLRSRRARASDGPPLPSKVDLDAVAAAGDPPPLPEAPVGPVIATAVEPPSTDVVAKPEVSRIPGAARDGYRTLPTAPVVTTMEGPAERPTEGEFALWAPPPPRAQRPVAGPWALALAIVALAASLLVGWMLPVGVAAIVIGVIALRRRIESRAVATWAIALGAVAVIYSAGWLLWAGARLGLY